MRRVMVTGLGIVSCMGNNQKEVLQALRQGQSGLQLVPQMQELGYKCPIAGLVRGLSTEGIGKKSLQTMSEPAKYAAVATLEGLRQALIPLEALRSRKAGIVVGTGAGGVNDASRSETLLLTHKSPSRVGAMSGVRIMNSTAALNLAAWLGVKGRCYSVSSACCTGTDSIGHGFEMIRYGLLDICICGGAEGNGWRHGWAFGDAAGVLPTEYNDVPDSVCRPYDRQRRGMVPSEGAGIVILEALEHAERRHAPVYAELVGYGSANDGDNMFEPRGTGLKRSLLQALAIAQRQGPLRIDYINPHGAGTRIGDPVEVQAIRQVFGEPTPLVSSTKPLNGHAQGAAGAHEAIFTLLMLHHGFVVPTKNLRDVAPECEGVRHVRALMDLPLQAAMTFNAGLGGTNACLIFKKPD